MNFTVTTEASKSTDALVDELTDLAPVLEQSLVGNLDTTGAAGLIIKRLRGGRPGVVKKNKRKVLLPLDADEDDMYEAIGFEPGVYRVYAADAACRPIGAEYCEYTLAAEDMGFTSWGSWGGHADETVMQSITSIQKVNKGLLDTLQAAFLTACDNQKAMIASLTNSYQGQAELVRANIEGFKALSAAKLPAAPEPAEPEKIAREIVEQLDLDQEDEKPAQHWLIDLLRSPPFSTVGPIVAQQWIQGKQAQAMAAAKAAQAAAAPPAQPARANGGGDGESVEYVTVHEDVIQSLKAEVIRDIRSEIAASLRAEIADAVSAMSAMSAAAMATQDRDGYDDDRDDHDDHDAGKDMVEEAEEDIAGTVTADPVDGPEGQAETSEPAARGAGPPAGSPAVSVAPDLRELARRMNNHAVDRSGPPKEPSGAALTSADTTRRSR